MRWTPWVLVLAMAGCEADDWGPEKLGQGRSNAELNQLIHGREIYATYCVGCHGEKGDGQGPAARFLDPKPRDFTKGRVKFAAVEAGEAPNDADYERIITHGLDGTSMPTFSLLPIEDRDAVIEYIKSFYLDWAADQPGAPITVGQDPWQDDVEGGLAEGQKVYHGLAKCWSCHPAYETRRRIVALNLESDLAAPSLRDDLYESVAKDSQWGAPITAPDFFVDRVKTGLELQSLALVIASGVGGTAMPTWAGSLQEEQLWGLAYYVRSIALKRGTPEARTLRQRMLTETSTVP